MYYDNINYNIYSCLSASAITTACSGASKVVYQWLSAVANEGTFYQCQTLSTLNATKSADCSGGKKLWLDEVNTPNSYVCTTLTVSTCTGSNLLYYDNVNLVYSCNSQT